MISRKLVADEEEMAASFHFSILNYIEEHPDEKEEIVNKYGDENWHRYWLTFHLAAAELLRNPQLLSYEEDNAPV